MNFKYTIKMGRITALPDSIQNAEAGSLNYQADGNAQADQIDLATDEPEDG